MVLTHTTLFFSFYLFIYLLLYLSSAFFLYFIFTLLLQIRRGEPSVVDP